MNLSQLFSLSSCNLSPFYMVSELWGWGSWNIFLDLCSSRLIVWFASSIEQAYIINLLFFPNPIGWFDSSTNQARKLDSGFYWFSLIFDLAGHLWRMQRIRSTPILEEIWQSILQEIMKLIPGKIMNHTMMIHYTCRIQIFLECHWWMCEIEWPQFSEMESCCQNCF